MDQGFEGLHHAGRKITSLIDKQMFRTEFQHNIQNPKATCFTAGRFFVPENCADARFWGMVLDSKQGQARKAVLLHIMNKGGGIHEKKRARCALHIYRGREEP